MDGQQSEQHTHKDYQIHEGCGQRQEHAEQQQLGDHQRSF